MAAIQTLKTLRDQVLAWLDESDDTGTTATNVDNALNQAHQQRVMQEAWPFMLWDTAETFSTVAGQSEYVLHSEFARPLYFLNRSSNALLVETPFRGIEQTGALWNTNVGVPGQFYLHAHGPVAAQPTIAQTVSITSSSAMDTGSTFTVIVRGVTSAGVISETLTAAGNAVVTSTNAFSKILNVTKVGTWAGTLTLAADTTLLTLGAEEYGRSYTHLFFLTIPDGSSVIEYKFYRQPSPLANDNDIPDIPPPFAQILVWDTLLMFGGYNSDIGGTAMSVWRDNQQKLEQQMSRAFQDAQSLGAGHRSVRYMGDNDSPVRFIR
jgi:hypothetical protein